MRHTNIIAIKDVIILEKAREKILAEGPIDIIVPAEIGQALSFVNFA